jgi:endogenous inhibitor of DNA gyrase (YacG/DUF329 family)
MDQMKKEELEITISDSDRIECAIRHIKTSVDIDSWAMEIAVEAMEKQIPKKPTDEGWLYCPICGKDILMERYKFCPGCGQAIDLEDE